MKRSFVVNVEQLFNILGLVGIFSTLALALSFQLIFKELPCPLCLLQRFGFLGVALGFLLNLRFGLRPSHYATVQLSALFTGFVALRQVALHVIPGSEGYGDPLFGYHLYTWSFILSMVILIGSTLMMGVDAQYQRVENKPFKASWLTFVLFVLLGLFVVSDLTTVFCQCGFGMCPANPIAGGPPTQCAK